MSPAKTWGLRDHARGDALGDRGMLRLIGSDVEAAFSNLNTAMSSDIR